MPGQAVISLGFSLNCSVSTRYDFNANVRKATVDVLEQVDSRGEARYFLTLELLQFMVQQTQA
jgi:hypothetical protein